MFSVPELLIMLVIVLIIFGAKKLPQVGDSLGRAIKNFKRASAPDEGEEPESEPAPAPAAAKKQVAAKETKQLGSEEKAEQDGDDEEWEEVVVRRKKKKSAAEG
ncbi:MAG TPA: twin-arginine translocase TatA/TatE family subunit [Kofleriaceae bacterium]|nr:twin-arginine translocase TatA/TatE family subunit [Kofleriaceae bacterium]